MFTWRCTINKAPVAWARPRFNSKTGVVYTAKEQRHYGNMLALLFAGAKVGKILKPLEVACALTIRFYVKRPKSCAAKYPTGKPDEDNLLKITQDALKTAGIVKDDSYIVEAHPYKLFADDREPCTVIELECLE